MHSILIVEDDRVQRHVIRGILEKGPAAQLVEAADGVEALQRLKNPAGHHFALMLLDLNMPVMDGLSLLRQVRKSWPSLPCIVLTGTDSMEDAVLAMQLGAVDFISKPAQPERLLTSARNAMAMHDLKEEVTRLSQDRSPCYGFDELVELSPSLGDIAALGRKAAVSDIPVLITGESGVGKEIVARAIHKESPRTAKAFVPLNCGALPDNLVESTLFGHEKGAFTGAVTRTIGKCREADGGVLFLDEVGELKPDTQVKLLRMLQQGEIEPVGAGRPMKVDVRVISATNRPLEQMVAQGRFREDLYYRLQGLPLHLPPLRERRRDVPALAEHLLARLAMTENRNSMSFSQDALDWMISYGWPGNVRELQHILHRAVLLAESDRLEGEDLSRWAQARSFRTPARRHASAAPPIQLEGPDGRFKTLEEIEQEAIEAALAYCGSHIGKAAAILGVGQSTLYKRMKRRLA